jgi:GMP synthase (glutamine-hydrolysing)
MKQDMIIILDLGSDKNSELARRIRALGVYSEIHPHDLTAAELSELPNVKGIILNGGENNIIDGQKIDACRDIYASGLPVLALNHSAGGKCTAEYEGEITEKALSDFIFEKCGCSANWNMANFIDDQTEMLKARIGSSRVLLALSGGVDSSVVAALLIRAIGDRLTCIHVNHGLLRKGEPEQVVRVFREELKANLIYVDAVDRFLGKLAGVTDPERKRKIIGAEFIEVFEEEAAKIGGAEFLAQGTIYPDIVESGTKTAKAVKAHHNVGGLPEKMNMKLVEPLKFLFKDEVRACGKQLGLPDNMVYRQPFPGPGLGVRCLGAITRERLEAVRESDAILREEFRNAGLEGKVWQYFTLIPDLRSVGVRNNARSFEYPVIIRAVNTVDAMTAEIEHPDWNLLDRITKRIINEVKGVNRVCYDLTPKPTGTIEWE